MLIFGSGVSSVPMVPLNESNLCTLSHRLVVLLSAFIAIVSYSALIEHSGSLCVLQIMLFCDLNLTVLCVHIRTFYVSLCIYIYT